MLGGHAVISPIGACRVMKLNDELASAHPLTEPIRAGESSPTPIDVQVKTA
jgi:hypothetical protein